MPSLMKEAEIPVYVIHSGSGAADYFFLFDFEVFMERSKAGMFVRPKLKVWAGRHDFDRRGFARQFRETFAAEFDRMRRVAGTSETGGWLNWDPGGWMVDSVAYLIIALALGVGKAVASMLPLPGLFKGSAPEAKVEADVDALRGRVDAALERIEIALHPELYAHAYRGQTPGPFVGMDYEAWPLPDYVRTHLDDGRSGSWW